MTDAERDAEIRHWQLVRYFHDCLAAQTDWARAVNIIDQRDLTTLPLSSAEQVRLGSEGELRLSDAEAIDLAKRVSISGDRMSLVLGALFLVGSMRSRTDQSEKQFCAPLLEVPVELQMESGDVLIIPEESEFTVNYSLVSELLIGDANDLQDRLAELAECVPDFPIDETEFQSFWTRFRLVAPEILLEDSLPEPRRAQHERLSSLAAESLHRRPAVSPNADRIEMIDFFLPQIPKAGRFRLLPAAAVILGPKAGGAMSALSELREMTEVPLSRTAFGSLFDPLTAQTSPSIVAPRSTPDDIYPLPLSPTQEAILHSARREPLTVVTGPPGTGKSYTITAIVLDALLRGESVLVASQMDKAVEVVADHVETIAGPLAIARSGGRAAQRQLAKKVAQFTGPRSRLGNPSDETLEQCERKHHELSRQQQSLEQSLASLIEAETRWSELFQTEYRTKSLLPSLASSDVTDEHIRQAARRMERASARLNDQPGWIRKWLAKRDMARVRRLLNIPSDKQLSLRDLQSILSFHLLAVQRRDIERLLESPLPADTAWRMLVDVERQRHQSALELLKRDREKRMRSLVADSSKRSALRDLATLLRRRKEDVKLQLQASLTAELLLESFPAWACTSRTLCEILPATPGLFDLVIIDEASQCDLALASVALMRGKRAVVVGDPHQLRHVCFLSGAREQASFVRHDIAPEMQRRFHYRRSLFDVAADTVSARSFYFLDEHFRSHPHIIEFSNRKFYEGSLSIMTGRPSTQRQAAIQTQIVAGRREPDSSVNLAEIDAVMTHVQRLVQTDPACSIGIVSPFRDHADAIKVRLVREQPAEILTRHAIVVGTAHSLQGDEKDVVILSTSIDHDAHPASLRFLESPNLFNVAITRARRELIVVTSMSAEELPTGLFREFLVHAEKPWSAGSGDTNSTGLIEQTIATSLGEDMIPCLTGFHAAGTRIDVVAIGARDALAILCDRAGMNAPQQTLETQRRLARAGWTISRLSHRAVEQHWNACRANVLQKIAQ